MVSLKETFTVGDHDFMKLSLIPSVVLHVKLPDTDRGILEKC